MKFAKSSHESFSKGSARTDSTKEIPTAAFVTGENFSALYLCSVPCRDIRIKYLVLFKKDTQRNQIICHHLRKKVFALNFIHGNHDQGIFASHKLANIKKCLFLFLIMNYESCDWMVIDSRFAGVIFSRRQYPWPWSDVFHPGDQPTGKRQPTRGHPEIKGLFLCQEHTQ